MPTKHCKKCGKLFQYYQSQDKKYCSIDCYRACNWMKNQKGKLNTQYNDNIDTTQMIDLYVNFRKSITQLAKDLGCGRTLIRKRLKSNGIKLRSYKEQFNIALSNGISYRGSPGKSNPAYSHGKCDVCNTDKTTINFDLVVHHKNFNNKDNDLGNLRILCQACHTKLHVVKKKYGESLNLIKIESIEWTNQEVEMYDLEVQDNHNFILSNGVLTHNSGKSLCIKHFCQKHKLPYYRIVMNAGTTTEDIVGQMLMDKDGKFNFNYQVLVNFMKHGGVFVFDEINAGQKEILHILNSITDWERRLSVTQNKGEVITASDNFLVVACCNPPDEYDLQDMSISLKSRFCTYYFDYDIRIDRKVLGNAKLVSLATSIRKARTNGQINTPLSTRDLVQFNILWQDLGYDLAKEMLVNKFSNGEKEVVRTMIETHLDKSQVL